MNTPTAYPLAWPDSWPRTKSRKRSNFKTDYAHGNKYHSMARATAAISNELQRLGATRTVLSTNVELRLDGLPYANRAMPSDPGAAVYFELKNRPISLACDKWDRVECNIWAIAKHIEALRGQERWGIGTVEQAFTGYMALPAPMVLKPWWEVFGVAENVDREFLQDRYRQLAKINHPDAGGNTENMAEINAAFDAAKLARGWN